MRSVFEHFDLTQKCGEQRCHCGSEQAFGEWNKKGLKILQRTIACCDMKAGGGDNRKDDTRDQREDSERDKRLSGDRHVESHRGSRTEIESREKELALRHEC